MPKYSELYVLTRLAFNLGAMATKSVSVAGAVGTNLDVTPEASSNNILYKMVVNAALASDNATLKIYKDSAVAGNLLYDGYMADRDASGAVSMLTEAVATTKWIVVVTGGSGDLIVSAKYS